MQTGSGWQSNATNQRLRERGEFLKTIRYFFDAREVLEVDVPCLMRGVNTDPFIKAFRLGNRFLQTSPEFAMKRLLANKIGAIYYLGKAYRDEEVGRHHNPEFTLLEWYRPEWDDKQLIEEVGQLFHALLGASTPVIKTYAELFAPFGINPHEATLEMLEEVAQSFCSQGIVPPVALDRVGWLDWLFMVLVEPSFNKEALIAVTDFPVVCAQLAKAVPHPEFGQVAARFEFFYQGMELANGYFELTDATEQARRFSEDNHRRQGHQLPSMPIDERLLAALDAGIGKISGVAVGVDRLLMLKAGAQHIREILPFDWEIS